MLALGERYERRQRPDDLDAVIDLLHEEVDDASLDRQGTRRGRSDLAHRLWQRFGRRRDITDIDEAVTHLRFLTSTAVGRSGLETMLGMCLMERHSAVGDPADVDEALEHIESGAQEATSAEQWNEVGGARLRVFATTKSGAALDGAVVAYGHAVEGSVGKRHRPGFFGNLGNARLQRWHHAGDAGDLDAAIDAYEQALEGEQAIEVYTMAVVGAPPSPLIAGTLVSLARALFERDRDADRARANALLARVAKAIEATDPEAALFAARLWGDAEAEQQRWGRAAEAYRRAQDAVDELVRVQLGRRYKEARLSPSGDVGARAAFAFARDGRPGEAAQAFERARARLLSDALELERVDLDRLVTLGRPDLVERYERAAAAMPCDRTWRIRAVADPRISAAFAAEAAGDLDAAVAAWDAVRAALSDAVPAESRAQILDAAARVRLRRAWAGGPPEDLDAAVALWRRAAELLPVDAGSRGALLNNLGVALRELSERERRPELLDEAIGVALDASAASTADAPAGATARLQLGKALRERFRRRRSREDLDAAITALAQAGMAIGEAELAGCHEELGNALYDRYMLAGAASDQDDAVVHLARAAELIPDDDIDAPGYWSNLASALLGRYEVGDRRADLDEAIGLLEHALETSGDGSSELLTNLGNASRMRAVADASLDDMDRAIELLRRAAALADDKLSNLAAGLLERFDLTGRIGDVDEAIRVLAAALDATPAADPALPSRLNNLGIALRTRQLRRAGGREDVDRAIAAFERALELTGVDEPDAAALHANLGNALHQRHDLTGGLRDLDRSVRELETALQATPRDSADRASTLNNLGATLSARADAAGSAEDVARAVALTREAVRLCPQASARRATYLVNLANALAQRGDDPAAARDAYREAVRVGLLASPAEALAAAQNWSGSARDRRAWDEVAEACEAGQQAARTLFGTQLLRADKESWLRDAHGLTSDGAYALIARSRLPQAATVLERGRALLLSERLALDAADLGRLASRAPPLAARFRAAAAEVRRLEAAL